MELIIGLGLLILFDLLALRFGAESRDGFRARGPAPGPESLHFHAWPREGDDGPASNRP